MKCVNFLGFCTKPISISLLLITSLMSWSSYAVHISAYRIYLDEDNRDSQFIVFNRDVESQECDLKLRHYNFDANGKMSKYTGEKSPDNSAKKWIRYSPKKFTLTPANSQTVRFSLRRKAKALSGEYRSYLVVDCGAEQTNNEKQMISIKPKLMHNVPIIVRVGELSSELTFSDIQVKNDGVKFNLKRSGSSSVYGDVEVVNKKTKERISHQLGLSVYPETDTQAVSLSLRDNDPKDLMLRFTENQAYGGSKVYEAPIVSD